MFAPFAKTTCHREATPCGRPVRDEGLRSPGLQAARDRIEVEDPGPVRQDLGSAHFRNATEDGHDPSERTFFGAHLVAAGDPDRPFFESQVRRAQPEAGGNPFSA